MLAHHKLYHLKICPKVETIKIPTLLHIMLIYLFIYLSDFLYNYASNYFSIYLLVFVSIEKDLYLFQLYTNLTFLLESFSTTKNIENNKIYAYFKSV